MEPPKACTLEEELGPVAVKKWHLLAMSCSLQGNNPPPQQAQQSRQRSPRAGPLRGSQERDSLTDPLLVLSAPSLKSPFSLTFSDQLPEITLLAQSNWMKMFRVCYCLWRSDAFWWNDTDIAKEGWPSALPRKGQKLTLPISLVSINSPPTLHALWAVNIQ